MARVAVTVTARDLTRAELARMRRNFGNLGDDLNRMIGARTQANFLQLRDSVNQAGATLRNLRGSIPDEEFRRLNAELRTAQQTLRRGFGRVDAPAMDDLLRRLQAVDAQFRRLNQSNRIRVRVNTRDVERSIGNVDGNRVRGMLTRSLMSPLRAIGGLIGGTLSDGIGQGIFNGIKSAGPIVATLLGAIVLTAGATIASVLGAAIAGALVFALGAGFVGIAAISAVKSAEIQRNWKAAAKNIGKDLAQAGEPLIPVIHRAIHVLEGMSADFAPHFREAMEKAAPHLDSFIQNTKEGFRKMGQHAWDDLQEAFRVFLAAFGPMWEDFLSEFGKSLGALARTVRDHSSEIAAALRIVLGILNLLVDTINFLANAWVTGIRMMIDGTSFLLDALATLTDGFMGMIDSMIGGIESVAGLFGFEDEVARARASFNEMRNDTVAKFRDMSMQIKQTGIDMDVTNRKRILEVDIASWSSQLSRAKEELKSVPPEKRSAVKADISDLEGKIARAQAELNGMRKDYYVRIHAYRTGDWAIGGGGPFAHGGVVGNVGRAATGGARSNMTLVGEQGPEIVNLAPGSHVRSNPDSRRLMGGGEGGGPIAIQLILDGQQIAEAIFDPLRHSIRTRGGNVQSTLGQKGAA